MQCSCGGSTVIRKEKGARLNECCGCGRIHRRKVVETVSVVERVKAELIAAVEHRYPLRSCRDCAHLDTDYCAGYNKKLPCPDRPCRCKRFSPCCAGCGGVSEGKYCSDACKQKAYRRRHD